MWETLRYIYCVELQERDVPETDGSDERHRRMPLRRKVKTDEPSVFMSFHLGISVCVICLGLRSLEDRRPPRRMPLRRMFLRRMSPRRMPPRRKKAEKEEDRVGCPRDGRCVVVVVVVFEDCGSQA